MANYRDAMGVQPAASGGSSHALRVYRLCSGIALRLQLLIPQTK